MKQLILRTVLPIVLMLLILSEPVSVCAAEVPYDSYNYDYWNKVVFTPAAYVPDDSISGVSLGTTPFLNPQDIFVAQNGLVYLADTGNNRVLILSEDMKSIVKEIKEFDNQGTADTFNAPYGVCATADNELYIADSQNNRIVVLDLSVLLGETTASEETPELVKIIENPVSDVLEADYVFTPLKVTVDYAGRVYVVAQFMFQGVMVFEKNGQFTSFFGTIPVKISTIEKFWKKFKTKEQREKSLMYIATEYTGIDVDPSGFLYASYIDSAGIQAVMRLNPNGQDVIKKGQNANLGGDIWIDGMSEYSGPSRIIDVVYRDKGIYSLLDAKRGRIFTYDYEGNLLYIFGGIGTQEGTFVTPVAIEANENKILVLDSYRAEIISFTPSEYGTLINDAVGLRYDGDETLAVDKWNEVLKYNENLELANVGIGKAYLTTGEYKLAMKYLKLGMSRQYYSIAYKRYRNEFLKANLGYFMTGALVLIAAWFVFKGLRRKNRKAKGGRSYE